MTRTTFLITLLCMLVDASTREVAHCGESVRAARLVDWSADNEIPHIRTILVHPRSKSDSRFLVSIRHKEVTFKESLDTSSAALLAPFPTDEMAVAAARDWILNHFGDLQAEVSLKVMDVRHSASGTEKPKSERDVGHTVCLGTTYRGILTSDYATIYFTGRIVESANVRLSRFTEVKPAKRVISAQDAVAAWTKFLREMSHPAEFIERIEKDARPRLTFVRIITEESYKLGYVELSPMWALVLDRDDRMMVYAHSGKIKFND